MPPEAPESQNLERGTRHPKYSPDDEPHTPTSHPRESSRERQRRRRRRSRSASSQRSRSLSPVRRSCRTYSRHDNDLSRARCSRRGGDDGDGSVSEKSPWRRRRRRDPTRHRHHEEPTDDNGHAVAPRQGGPLPSQLDSFISSHGDAPPPAKPKEKPNFGNTGLLAAASNQAQRADGGTVTLKYHEPPEARKPGPRDQWKLFIFQGSDVLDTVDLNLRSCWLIGCETAVVDLVAKHSSISKQHAVIQFRYLEKRNEYGDRIGRVKPYLVDLESFKGTRLNGDAVPDSRFLEIKHKDMLQFGDSPREYVVMLTPRD